MTLYTVTGRACQNSGHCENVYAEFTTQEDAGSFWNSAARTYNGWRWEKSLDINKVEIAPVVDGRAVMPNDLIALPSMVKTLPYFLDIQETTTSTPSTQNGIKISPIFLLGGLWLLSGGKL